MIKFSLLKTLTLLSSFSLLVGCSSSSGNTTYNEITSNPDTSIPTTSSEPEIDDTSTYRINVSSTLYKIVKNIDITYGSKTFRGDPEVFNNDLALFEFLFVTDAHNEGVCYYSNQTQPQENENTKFLANSGYSNVKEYHVQSSDSEDSNDTTNIVIGSKVYNTNQVDINVAILGTQTTEEWDSNVDVGSSNPNYNALTGEHSDWVNKKNHKGFDVAANRVAKQIETYISNFISVTNPEFHYVITGYSRGAAIANILGASLEDGTSRLSSKDSRTYTFATPNTTDDTDASKYKTIFNFINDDDVIAKVPPTALSMVRYGKDINNHIKGTALESAFKKDTSKDYFKSTYNVTTIINSLNYIAGIGRYEMYTIQEDNNDYLVKSEVTEDNKATLETNFANTKTNIEKMGLTKYVKYVEVTKNTESGKYYAGYYVCVAFVAKIAFKMISEMSKGNSSAMLSYISYINSPLFTKAGGLSLAGAIDGDSLTNAHMPLPYFYFVTGTTK